MAFVFKLFAERSSEMRSAKLSRLCALQNILMQMKNNVNGIVLPFPPDRSNSLIVNIIMMSTSQTLCIVDTCV